MSALAGRARLLLTLCAVAVAFAAVDTYVVVLALPDMMTGVKLSAEELNRAAPIVSGFLLGYVAMLPLIGRIADLRGQVPVLRMSLVVFSVGSLVTTISMDLPTMVAGRFLQGVGGGGLVPATMSLVALLYPVERRGLPLGVVSAVQEFGSVLGPLFGAAVLAFTSWRGIFAINVAAGVLLAVAVGVLARTGPAVEVRAPAMRGPAVEARAPAMRGPAVEVRAPASLEVTRPRFDWLGALALVVTVVAGGIAYLQPGDLQRDLTWGQLFIPYVDGGSKWVTPIGVVTLVALAVLIVRLALAKRPLVDYRGWFAQLVEADLPGALLLAAVLGGIVLAFATSDPEVAVFSPQGPWFLLGSALAAVVLVVHLRRSPRPVVPRGALRRTPAWGALVVSFLVGWALIAALVDVPLFARTTTQRDSQLGAALVLLRFLAALPVGALVGGWLLRRVNAGVLTATGMLAAAAGFLAMGQWGATSLDSAWSALPLVVGGFGFGLALAPVNAAMLATTSKDAHGLTSALVVVARMVGMLVGISALTTIGLRRFYAAQEADPDLSLTQLGIVQEHVVFNGAAVVAVLAAVLAVVLLSPARTRGVDAAEVLRAVG